MGWKPFPTSQIQFNIGGGKSQGYVLFILQCSENRGFCSVMFCAVGTIESLVGIGFAVSLDIMFYCSI